MWDPHSDWRLRDRTLNPGPSPRRESPQDNMWAWSDIESEIDDGAILSLHNAPTCTSDEHQLRTPPFYVANTPWFVRLYAANSSGKGGKEGEGGSQFLAAYLDASLSLRENPEMEKQVFGQAPNPEKGNPEFQDPKPQTPDHTRRRFQPRGEVQTPGPKR